MTSVRARAGRIPTVLLNVAMAAALLVALGFLVPGALGFERYVITGGSMSGSIERGSLVYASRVPVATLQVGDVITYAPPADTGLTELVTHRIASIEVIDGARTFRTKGDANAAVDPWTFGLDADMQARVDLAVPGVGYLLMALADPAQRMLLLGVPAAIAALLSALEIVRRLRRRSVEAVPTEQAGLLIVH